MPTLYLIHFSTPYVAKTGKQQKKAGHYLGYTTVGVDNRMAAHRSGQGARLIAVIQQDGIDWEVSRVWEGEGREEEKKRKRRGHFADYCPCCNQKIAHLRHRRNRRGVPVE